MGSSAAASLVGDFVVDGVEAIVVDNASGRMGVQRQETILGFYNNFFGAGFFSWDFSISP